MAVTTVHRIVRISLTTADPEGQARFYCEAFGCERIGVEERRDAAFGQLMNLQGARAQIVALRLGDQEIELVDFHPVGRPYPEGTRSSDLIFQHFAIVVADMRQAYARLLAQPGWMPITTGGPQTLPESSGGVTAFKFRDPEGHPLELLAFPPQSVPPNWRHPKGADPCLGIDHSAIAVANTNASRTFYGKLGFTVAGQSLNRGDAQGHLDGLSDPVVEVTALQAGTGTAPHVELLCYRHPVGEAAPAMRSNDIAKTRLVLGISGVPQATDPGAVRDDALIHDPDGHDLILRGTAE